MILKNGIEFDLLRIPRKVLRRTSGESDNLEKLQKLRRESERKLLKVRTVFPFTIFPDTLIVDYKKISIIKKDFFLSERINSINHEDILNSDIITGPIFATLRITTKFFDQKPLRISYLWRRDAINARKIINGIQLAIKENISFDDINKKELIENLLVMGKSNR